MEWAVAFPAHHVDDTVGAPVPALGKKQTGNSGAVCGLQIVGMEAFQGSLPALASIVNRHSISDDPSLTRSVVAQGCECPGLSE